MPWQAHSRRGIRLALAAGVLALLVATGSTPVGATAPSENAVAQPPVVGEGSPLVWSGPTLLSTAVDRVPGGAKAVSSAGDDGASPLLPLLLTLGILTALVVLAGFVFRAARLTVSNGLDHRPEAVKRRRERPAADRGDCDRIVELLRETDRPPTEAHIAETLEWSPARTRQAVMKLVADGGALRYETDERARVVFIGSRRHSVDDEGRGEWSPNGRRPPHRDGSQHLQQEDDESGSR
ncbi:hypothetical protein [Salinigranum marinum]|uniref:hypothetical protein n=1 Tax=Salinigranum marinum TaxID=1515595 RepID=UPI002989CA50|nr:hypothetical protein [Salinigranum marinum]